MNSSALSALASLSSIYEDILVSQESLQGDEVPVEEDDESEDEEDEEEEEEESFGRVQLEQKVSRTWRTLRFLCRSDTSPDFHALEYILMTVLALVVHKRQRRGELPQNFA